MSTLINIEKNVILKIDLTGKSDFDNEKCDNENWISFVLHFECDKETIEYGIERECAFSVGEIKSFLKMIDELIKVLDEKKDYAKYYICNDRLKFQYN